MASLVEAAGQSNLALVRRMIGDGADVNAQVDGITPLMAACAPSLPDLDVLKELLSAGADPNAGEVLSLHHAALRKNDAVALLLLENGADPNRRDENGQTALHKAADGYTGLLVRLLLDHGADPNVTDKNGQTPLLVALRQDNEDAVDLLRPLTKAENVERPWRSSDSRASRESRFVEACGHGDADFVREMLAAGVSPEAHDENGTYGLHVSAACGQEQVVAMLLDGGANIELCNALGATPLIAAASYGRAGVVRLLLERGALATAEDHDGRTSIFANLGSHVFLSPEVVEMLIRHGCDPQKPDRVFRLKPSGMLEHRYEADSATLEKMRQLLA